MTYKDNAINSALERLEPIRDKLTGSVIRATVAKSERPRALTRIESGVTELIGNAELQS